MGALKGIMQATIQASQTDINEFLKTAGINYDVKVQKLAEEADIPLISLKSSGNDYEKIFGQLKSLNPLILSNFASSKHLDWSGIEKLFSV